MSVLLLRLAAPMQSWGTTSRFIHRDTGLEPSKSGIIGLLCAALGRGRESPVGDLASLTMAVRVEREGSMARDYHTALDVAKADGSAPGTVVSERYYLADADFLVGLQGQEEHKDLLAQLNERLAAPVWPLYLGRKSFVPGLPVQVPGGLRGQGDLPSVLKSFPWQPRSPHERGPAQLRLVLECGPNEGEVRNDVPLSFAERRFTIRYVTTEFCPTPAAAEGREDAACS
ncbi:MAG: type I-E CRISPR-associated protein Cas5/CasD [Thermoguttaceae bacterium]